MCGLAAVVFKKTTKHFIMNYTSAQFYSKLNIKVRMVFLGVSQSFERAGLLRISKVCSPTIIKHNTACRPNSIVVLWILPGPE